jgi:hypothetical protein
MMCAGAPPPEDSALVREQTRYAGRIQGRLAAMPDGCRERRCDAVR